MNLKEKCFHACEDSLEKIKDRIAQLQDRASQTGTELKDGWDRFRWDLSDRRNATRYKWHELKEAGAEKLEIIKYRAEKAWDDLQDAVGKVWSRFKK